MRTALARYGLILLASLGGGCAALHDDMVRAEGSFELARYEDTVVWLSDLEADVPSMDQEMRARFYYLRGMAAFRLGNRPDALHYLALAREVAGPRNQGLRIEWASNLRRTIAEMVPDEGGSQVEDEERPRPIDNERPGRSYNAASRDELN